MAEFRMPSLGADMEHGTLLQWHVHPGDTVHEGDIVAEVDTAKAAIEVECFDDGTIGEILVPEGATVPVGTILATIEPATSAPSVSEPATSAPAVSEAATSAPAEPEPEPRAAAPAVRPDRSRPSTTRSRRRKAASAAAHAKAPAATTVTRSEHPAPAPAEPSARPTATPVVPHILATPLIRRLAEEAGIELASIRGTGHDGRVLRGDVERAIAALRTPVAAESTPTATGSPAHGDGRSAHVRASGYARRLARELAVELASITGTGPAGAIQADDVRAAAPANIPAVRQPPPAPRPPPQHGAADMRRAIAAAMTHSKQTIPHYYLSSTIDLAAATDWLREVNAAAPVPDRIIMAALQLRAVAQAARKVPAVNGYWVDDTFRPADTVDIGVIVSLRGGGIIAPTIAGADTLPVRTVMAQLRGAVGRARSGRLLSSDTTPATITVTNLGEMGVDSVIGVIPPPQVAIVGFGTVGERPCAVNGLLGVRPQVTVTLAADHRASDGAVGARFLNTVAELLQHPDQL